MTQERQSDQPSVRLLKTDRSKFRKGRRDLGFRGTVAFWDVKSILIVGSAFVLVGPVTVFSVLMMDPSIQFNWSRIFIVSVLAMPIFISVATILLCLWVNYEWHRLLRQIEERKERKKNFRVINE